MEKKATLLIKNIAKIYTMQTKDILFTHGFIAIHHDEILDIGTSSYEHLLDKDTRVIDATGMIATPGFIECHGSLPIVSPFDKARSELAYTTCAEHKGVTTIAYRMENERVTNDTYPLCYIKQHIREQQAIMKTPFCLSSFDHQYQDCDLLLAARLLYLYHRMDGMELLRTLSVYPAAFLHRENIGTLAKKQQGDVVLFRGECIEEIFQTFEEHRLTHVIKRGVRIFPTILI